MAGRIAIAFLTACLLNGCLLPQPDTPPIPPPAFPEQVRAEAVTRVVAVAGDARVEATPVGDGTFELRLPPGRYDLEVVADGAPIATPPVDVPAGGTKRVVVTVKDGVATVTIAG